MLLRDLPSLVLGTVIAAIGVISMVLYRLGRRAQRDRTPLWFSIFAVLYGVRILASTEVAGIASDLPERFWRYVIATVTYVISLPCLMLMTLIFPEWRRVLRIITWGMAAFALTGILCDIWAKQPLAITRVNSAITLAALITLLVALFRHRGRAADVRPIRIGLLLFSAAVIVENTQDLLGWRLARSIEPLGLLAFLISLGRVIARRLLKNSERLVALDKELEIARRIQSSILPAQMPSGQHWEIAALYVPMTAVAGDFYDFLAIDEQHIGILMADVSGHGVPAALIASMVKIAVAAQQPHAAHPARVLAGINETLSGNLQGQYVTAAYLYLDLKEYKARYAAAAHPALLRQSAVGAVESIEENGLMLGLFPHASFKEREFAIHPGDRFLLYTDGLLEATNREGEFFGAERASAALQSTGRLPPQASLDRLRASLETWAPVVEDDLTLLLLASKAAIV